MIVPSKFTPAALALLVAAALFVRNPVMAAVDPSAFVSDLANSAFETLRDPSSSEPERFSKFRALLTKGVDLPRVGRFVLGAHWKRADAAQQAEYQSLFGNYVIAAYAGRLKDYTEAKITVKETLTTDKGEYIVSTLVVHPKNPEPVHVDWRLREAEGKLRILDMTIEGVSMALTQRSEFSSIIQQNGGDINVLLARLRDTADAVEAGKTVTIAK